MSNWSKHCLTLWSLWTFGWAMLLAPLVWDGIYNARSEDGGATFLISLMIWGSVSAVLLLLALLLRNGGR